MFKAVGYDTKGEGLNLCLGFLRGISIGENPGQVNDFRDPPAVFLAFDFYLELQSRQNTALEPASLTARR